MMAMIIRTCYFILKTDQCDDLRLAIWNSTSIIEEKEKAASQEKQEGASGIVISDRGVDISKSLEEAEKRLGI